MVLSRIGDAWFGRQDDVNSFPVRQTETTRVKSVYCEDVKGITNISFPRFLSITARIKSAERCIEESGMVSKQDASSTLASEEELQRQELNDGIEMQVGRLESPNPAIRQEAARTLVECITDYRANSETQSKIVEPLVRALGDSNSEVREYAAAGLAKLAYEIDYDSQIVMVGPLIDALDDENNRVREYAVEALTVINCEHISDIPSDLRRRMGEPLVTALEDPNPRVPPYAARSLVLLTESHASSVARRQREQLATFCLRVIELGEADDPHFIIGPTTDAFLILGNLTQTALSSELNEKIAELFLNEVGDRGRPTCRLDEASCSTWDAAIKGLRNLSDSNISDGLKTRIREVLSRAQS